MTPAERALLWEVLGVLLLPAVTGERLALLERVLTARADAEREREG